MNCRSAAGVVGLVLDSSSSVQNFFEEFRQVVPD